MEKAVLISNIVLIVWYTIAVGCAVLINVNTNKKEEEILKKYKEIDVETYRSLLDGLETLDEKIDELLCTVGADLFIVVDCQGHGKIRGIYDEPNLAQIARDEVYDKENELCSIYTVCLNEPIQPGQLDVDHIVE